jgi:hypothetical protein
MGKLSIHKSTDPAAAQLRHNIQTIATRLREINSDVFAEDFSKALFAFLLGDNQNSPVLKHYGSRMNLFRHIDIVLAVPPGWSRREYEALSTAVARGLGDKRSFRIFRVSETECDLKSWEQEQRDLIQAEVSCSYLLSRFNAETLI